MRHASLFSGWGGFDLAAHWAGYENVFHCDFEPACQKVLNHYWPKSKCYGRVEEIDGTIYRGAIDVISGGPPCQPYSIGGFRKGSKDARDGWVETIRLVREIMPSFALIENVYGIAEMALDQWCIDLERVGYTVQTFDISASCVGLPTVERHLWIVAASLEIGLQGEWGKTVLEFGGKQGKFQGGYPGPTNRRSISESRFCDVGERVSRRLGEFDRKIVEMAGNSVPPQIPYVFFEAFKKWMLINQAIKPG